MTDSTRSREFLLDEIHAIGSYIFQDSSSLPTLPVATRLDVESYQKSASSPRLPSSAQQQQQHVQEETTAATATTSYKSALESQQTLPQELKKAPNDGNNKKMKDTVKKKKRVSFQSPIQIVREQQTLPSPVVQCDPALAGITLYSTSQKSKRDIHIPCTPTIRKSFNTTTTSSVLATQGSSPSTPFSVDILASQLALGQISKKNVVATPPPAIRKSKDTNANVAQPVATKQSSAPAPTPALSNPSCRHNIRDLPMQIQCDPHMVSIVFNETSSQVTPPSKAVKEALISLPTKTKSYAKKVASTTSRFCLKDLPSTSMDLTAQLEVEPLLSQMVPKDVQAEINEHIEMSKEHPDVQEGEVQQEAPITSPPKKEEDQVPVKDWQTLPTNISGKVAFFEKLMKYKTETPPAIDPTMKVKAEISEKVQSVHQQVQTSLHNGAPKTKNGARELETLASTPVAKKIERVQNFFPKDSNNYVPKATSAPPEKSAADTAAQSKAYPTAEQQQTWTLEESETTSETEANSEPRSTVTDVVSAMEKDLETSDVPKQPLADNIRNGHAATANTATSVEKEVDEPEPDNKMGIVQEEGLSISQEEKTNMNEPIVGMQENSKDTSRDLDLSAPTSIIPETSKVEEPLVTGSGTSAEDSHVEILSRDLASTVLREEEIITDRPGSPEGAGSVGSFPPLIRTLSRDDYPDIVRSSKKSRRPPSHVELKWKSYAIALAEGKKFEPPPAVDVSSFLAASSPSIAQEAKNNVATSDSQQSAMVESEPHLVSVENNALIEEETAQQIPDVSLPKRVEIKSKSDHSTTPEEDSHAPQEGLQATPEAVQEAKPPGQVELPGFKEVSRRKKTSEDTTQFHQSQLLQSSAVQEPENAQSSRRGQANINQFSVLLDSADSPEKKSKHKKKKSRVVASSAQTSNSNNSQKAVRFSSKRSSNATKTKGASEKLEEHQRPLLLVMPLHLLNNLLHKKPFSYIFDGVFWFLVLVFGGPVAAVGVVLLTIYRTIGYLLRQVGIGIIKPKKNPDRELAIVVTGCDTGFGKELASSLLSDGFVVFCCCLRKESLKAFDGDERAIPLKVDVTKDKDVDSAVKAVTKWLSAGDGRYIHGLVNNAGVGKMGLVDWLSMTDFETMMDINFHGMVRCCKKFLPLFKRQASEGFYSNARIVNMVSMAGLNKGGLVSVGYEASKHAADVFTTNLRLETKKFGLKVSVINPSFHKTEITKDMTGDLKKTWNALSPEKRQEYGQDFLEDLSHDTHMVHVVNWDSKNVVSAMANCLMFKNPPARVIVGSDARYFIILFRMLPTWLTSWIMSTQRRPHVLPAMMRRK